MRKAALIGLCLLAGSCTDVSTDPPRDPMDAYCANRDTCECGVPAPGCDDDHGTGGRGGAAGAAGAGGEAGATTSGDDPVVEKWETMPIRDVWIWHPTYDYTDCAMSPGMCRFQANEVTGNTEWLFHFGVATVQEVPDRVEVCAPLVIEQDTIVGVIGKCDEVEYGVIEDGYFGGPDLAVPISNLPVVDGALGSELAERYVYFQEVRLYWD